MSKNALEIEIEIEATEPKEAKTLDRNKIPAITEPMGRYWKQPDLAAIEIDSTHAMMGAADAAKLHNYDSSFPSGVYPGKMWRRTEPDGKSYLMWYGEHENPKMCTNNHRILIIV